MQCNVYIWNGEVEDTPKKFRGNPLNCFICCSKAIKKEKIYILGKSTADIQGLIYLAVGINLSRDDTENRDLFVCKNFCYK